MRKKQGFIYDLNDQEILEITLLGQEREKEFHFLERNENIFALLRGQGQFSDQGWEN